MTQRIRAAIIGTGGIARAHVTALQHEKERAEVVAAVDIEASRVEDFCATHEIPRAYTDAAEMLAAQQPQLVHIATLPRPITSGPGARRTIEFIASLYKSAMTGQPVYRGSISKHDPFYYRMCGSCPQERTAA